MVTKRENDDVARKAKGLRMARIAVGLAALAMIGAGLVFRLFADEIGVGKDQAQIMSLAFLTIGIADCMLLFFWNRLFAPSKTKK